MIYPGLSAKSLEAQINSGERCDALILSAYGSGNLPIRDEVGLLEVIKRAIRAGTMVVVVSQCKALGFYLHQCRTAGYRL